MLHPLRTVVFIIAFIGAMALLSPALDGIKSGDLKAAVSAVVGCLIFGVLFTAVKPVKPD